jgi:hypothetical protein
MLRLPSRALRNGKRPFDGGQRNRQKLLLTIAQGEYEKAGAYTRPLLSATCDVLASVPFCVQCVTSYVPSIY